jgi:hypothetical protein
MQDDTLETNAMTETTPGEERITNKITNQEQKQQLSENVAIGGLFLVGGIGLMLINWLMVLITNHYFDKMSFVGPSLACLGLAMMIPIRNFNKNPPKESDTKTEQQTSKAQKTFHPLRVVLVVFGGVLGTVLSNVFVKFLSGTL